MPDARAAREMMGCYVYVDGQYVRSELCAGGQSDEFDPRKPAVFVRNQRIAGAQLSPTRVFYYDAIDEQGPDDERARQGEYFSKLRRLTDTHVVLGQVRRGGAREQKGVDVQLAVDALRAATGGAVEAIALVTGDADFVPLARAIREAGPHVIIIGFQDSLSDALANVADRLHVFDRPPTDWDLPPEHRYQDPL